MPGLIQTPSFQKLDIKPLHPTFGAEIENVNLTNVSDETFQEILAAMAQVGYILLSISLSAAKRMCSMGSAFSETRAWTTQLMSSSLGASATWTTLGHT
jgi:alpha-ketoglutarate-dependent taurine dioxygenase